MQKPDWKVWEEDVQNQLHLRSTISSGNKFYDPSDGVTPGHPSEQESYPLMVDAKSTVQKSYSMSRNFLKDWKDKATEHSQSFALPVRFIEGNSRYSDWVVVPFEDYVELVRSYRKHNG